MARTLIIVTATWSLVATPPLCRGGWLTECCEHDTASASSKSESGCQDSDCGCTGEEQPREPKPSRRCAPCAAACAGMFKPADDTPLIIEGGALVAVTIGETEDAPKLGAAPRSRGSSRACEQRLPFPRSDIPLLI